LKVTVFYSWQSDTRAAANRTLIQDALEAAVRDLRDNESIAVEPVVDRDTLAIPGAPDISATILKKIDASAAIVADVTIVNAHDKGRPTPNPNVLIELGYALKSLSERRLILVQNVAFGGPELLPFDLRQKRILTYESPAETNSRADARRRLRAGLCEALSFILREEEQRPASEYLVELSISYDKKRISSERHDYQLRVELKNVGTRPITQWHVDLEIPTRLLDPTVTYALRIPERSNREQTYLRATQDTHPGVVFPDDTKLVSVDYRVDDKIFMDRGGLFDKSVKAIAYVHSELAVKAEKVVSDLQYF
jgi:hypothetical protein